MGLDCTYQAVPADLAILERVIANSTFAENVFYPFIAFCERLESLYYYKGSEFDEVRKIYSQWPDIRNWFFKPSSRMQAALVYLLDPESYCKSTHYFELENTFAFKFVHGEAIFNKHLTSTQGIPVRLCSPEFISDCVKFLDGFDLMCLKENFDPVKMSKIEIYKISAESRLEPVEDYFNNLGVFYRNMSKIGNLNIFVIED